MSGSGTTSVTIPTLGYYKRVSNSSVFNAYDANGTQISIVNNNISDAFYLVLNASASTSASGSSGSGKEASASNNSTSTYYIYAE